MKTVHDTSEARQTNPLLSSLVLAARQSLTLACTGTCTNIQPHFNEPYGTGIRAVYLYFIADDCTYNLSPEVLGKNSSCKKCVSSSRTFVGEAYIEKGLGIAY